MKAYQYTYADDVTDTKRGTDTEPKHETTVSFTRTATVNAVTRGIYSEWTAKITIQLLKVKLYLVRLDMQLPGRC